MKRLFSKFKCNVLDWHKPEDKVTYIGAGTFTGRCKYCGRKIMASVDWDWWSIKEN